MLDYSLCPANNSGKDTEGSYAYMFTEYPFIKPWADSLKQTGALRGYVYPPQRHPPSCALCRGAPTDPTHRPDHSRIHR